MASSPRIAQAEGGDADRKVGGADPDHPHEAITTDSN
jgi:hypothetical protein